MIAQLDTPEDQRGLRFLRLPHPRTGTCALTVLLALFLTSVQGSRPCISHINRLHILTRCV